MVSMSLDSARPRLDFATGLCLQLEQMKYAMEEERTEVRHGGKRVEQGR